MMATHTVPCADGPSTGADLRDFVQNAPVGMHEVGPDHRILWINRAELDLLGYHVRELVGRDMGELFANPVDFRRLVTLLRDRETVNHCEVTLRRADGTLTQVSLSCNVQWNGNEIARIRFIVRDVSDLKRSERELQRRRQEIESLNQRLRRSMSETHHRVKNNLQIIAALVDMQLIANDGLIPANELRRLEHHIQALAAIHDLLTVEARRDPALESISVKSTLDVMRPLVQEMVGDRPIRFTVQDVHLPVRQETALALLVNELIANAARHGKGPIELSLRVVDGQVRLDVCDEGPGFPAGFDPSSYKNTGLELVETVSHWDLQGSTAYTNTSRGGACASVTFPIQAAAHSTR